MLGLGKYKSGMAGPRVLLSLALLMGGMGGIVGRGTLAFFTSSTVSTANPFQGGIVDIAGDCAGRTGCGSTASVLSTSTFAWTTSGGASQVNSGGSNSSTACRNILTGQDIRTQGMTPGVYCVAPITINNTATNSVDAWMRVRLVRSTNSDSNVNDALNDRLKFYMSEYTAGTSTASALQSSDCTPAYFYPTWSLTGSTGSFSGVYGSSYAQFADFTNATGNRTALTSLGTYGKNLGAVPGISAVTPKTGNNPTSDNVANASTNIKGADQDQGALGLVNATAETGVPTASGSNSTAGTYTYATETSASTPTVTTTNSVTSNSTSQNGLRMRDGNGAAIPSEANMIATFSSSTGTGTGRNSFNLVGNDEITNPIHTTGTIGGTSGGTVGTASTSLSGPNGANPHGSNSEAQILAGGSRYYCAAIFFPADTDQNGAIVYASTAAGSGTPLTKTYPTTYDTAAGQWRNCNSVTESTVTTNTTATANTGCSTLGSADTALTAANKIGDNLAARGSNTYYMVVTAAQKAGRTVA